MTLRRSPRLAAKGTGAKDPAPAKGSSKGPAADRKDVIVHMMKNLIEQCENARGTDNKVIVATTLFRFATDNAMDFIRSHLRLNNVMIFKAASLMVEGHRYPNMMVVLERFLEVSQINPADIRSFVRKIETRHAE